MWCYYSKLLCAAIWAIYYVITQFNNPYNVCVIKEMHINGLRLSAVIKFMEGQPA